MTGQSSGLLPCLDNTNKMIFKVNFLMKLLATIGQLCLEKSIKSTSVPSALLQSFALYRCFVQNKPRIANIYTKMSTSRIILMVFSSECDDLGIDLNFFQGSICGLIIKLLKFAVSFIKIAVKFHF